MNERASDYLENLGRTAGKLVLVMLVGLGLSACSQEQTADAGKQTEAGNPIAATADTATMANVTSTADMASSPVQLDVYKDPSCGCCQFWVDHAEQAGFQASIIHPENLNLEKMQRGIAPQFQSCHTSVSAEGYVFEGHVPAKLVQQFLQEQPADAIGLAVPGMPLGSPGMELGGRFTPYDVLLLKKDGSAEVYQHIASAAEQF
ncbi:MAG: DUF411 domain-containing protein [Pseudomonadales bacterium]|nr:DUF411 domain-containing protein [Pseudomonadales bacterium]